MLQDRLTKEMKSAGMDTVEGANRWLSETYIAEHNRMFAIEAEQAETAFVADSHRHVAGDFVHPGGPGVGNDNTVNGRD